MLLGWLTSDIWEEQIDNNDNNDNGNDDNDNNQQTREEEWRRRIQKK